METERIERTVTFDTEKENTTEVKQLKEGRRKKSILSNQTISKDKKEENGKLP